ncbi:MAG: dTMP kinase [Candidatus Eremiobacteraeota bacterium]|nr:dTMP kinase [Candidatus Eremiobacteraeota bacterium]
MFVTLEGIEGSGKSTLLSGLAERLRASGREPLVTREPGGTALGDAIRAIFLDRSLDISALSEAMLVNAARAQHVERTIRPALAQGRIVLCDRFVDSTLAYQGYGRGLDLAMLRGLCDAATAGLVPDVTFVLDVPLAVSRARTAARRPELDRLEAEDDAFHQRVREGFLALARSPQHRLLDGELDASALVASAMEALC